MNGTLFLLTSVHQQRLGIDQINHELEANVHLIDQLGLWFAYYHLPNVPSFIHIFLRSFPLATILFLLHLYCATL